MNRILLVEDEPANLAILDTYLIHAGYAVDQAPDGAVAWKMLEKEGGQYDVVITDRRMPNMDGIELSRRIKADPHLKSLPIIMQTAATGLSEIAEGVRVGVYYYLAKPYDEDTLLTLVKSAIRDREKSTTFEQRLSRQHHALNTIVNGEFHFKTPEEAENIALMLGSLFPRPELAITGLYELLLNAIEHGNLNIGFKEKSKLIAQSALDSEIAKRLNNADYRDKKVTVVFSRSHQEVKVTITDEGQGFDWRQFMEIEPSRATQGNGRGIAKANLISFDRLNYLGNGNTVIATSYFQQI